jgi:hypothetical protein
MLETDGQHPYCEKDLKLRPEVLFTEPLALCYKMQSCGFGLTKHCCSGTLTELVVLNLVLIVACRWHSH